MGPRLEHRVAVKISNWFRLSKKSRSYARLQEENPREPYRVSLSHRLYMRSVNSNENSSHSDWSCASKPNQTVKSTSDNHSHLPRLEIVRCVRFLQRLLLVTQSIHLSYISHRHSKKGTCQCSSHEINSSKRVQVPKGFLAVCVGLGEKRQRFWIPVLHFNHPLFVEFLKEVEEEYGFDHQGIINIPCDVADFQNLQKLMDAKHKGHGLV